MDSTLIVIHPLILCQSNKKNHNRPILYFPNITHCFYPRSLIFVFWPSDSFLHVFVGYCMGGWKQKTSAYIWGTLNPFFFTFDACSFVSWKSLREMEIGEYYPLLISYFQTICHLGAAFSTKGFRVSPLPESIRITRSQSRREWKRESLLCIPKNLNNLLSIQFGD